MIELNLLIALLLGHVVCDFYFQPTSWVTTRNQSHHRAKELYFHAIIHGAINFGILRLISGKDFIVCAKYAAILLAIHFITDLVKSYAPQNTTSFIIDQLVHLTTLFIAWTIFLGKSDAYLHLISVGNINYKHLVILLAYLITLKPTSILISILLKPWTNSVKALTPTNPTGNSSTDTLDSAGSRIGYLERILILTFILLNQFAAIGFLLAAKSVFRFGELQNDKDKKMTEYVLLGTLISFVCVIMIGLATSSIVSSLPIGK